MTTSGEVKKSTAGFRTLWSPPALYHDWDDEYEEMSSGWWELFTDLLLVVASSNIADLFKEDPDWRGLGRFVLQNLIFQGAWMHYTHHSSRFRDHSLFQSGLLFVYLTGMAAMVVHSSGFSSGEMAGFTAGDIIQKTALVFMFVNVAAHIPRARVHATVSFFFMVVMIGNLAFALRAAVTMAWGGSLTLWLWGGTLFVDRVVVPILGSPLLAGRRLVPINIDHIQDREGCYMMVVLGESVVSAALRYRSLPENSVTGRYYAASLLSFLGTYGLALIYFHIKPSRELHAYRRSRWASFFYLQISQILLMGILGVGVGVKLAMAVVTGQEGEHTTQMAPSHVWIYYGMLSLIFLALLCIRLLHFGGREPKPSDPPPVHRLKLIWWALIASWWLPPLVAAGVLTGKGEGRPLVVLGFGTTYVLVVVTFETIITHFISKMLGLWEGGGPHPASEGEEDDLEAPIEGDRGDGVSQRHLVGEIGYEDNEGFRSAESDFGEAVGDSGTLDGTWTLSLPSPQSSGGSGDEEESEAGREKGKSGAAAEMIEIESDDEQEAEVGGGNGERLQRETCQQSVDPPSDKIRMGPNSETAHASAEAQERAGKEGGLRSRSRSRSRERNSDRGRGGANDGAAEASRALSHTSSREETPSERGQKNAHDGGRRRGIVTNRNAPDQRRA
uniref:Uncharacterized protein n=1 Tax=Chromera velia CCMP2878 TaxID=1169474 RepID=A0A0G4FYW1_9ALVE|eukprot:Cvel_3949.t1-p1 / transcript=Cvel_3949.t1 / gene=Cvel_3949 / organism=Chromera_velia_CCMP2878 / gene_product=hypothetical protein / transcript_product=hypothetical protein / location=Cvel_scaffold167:112610-120964(-) / protein_length=671 / sequence_SO=supercontig / SO=protein_coding / is_pseudo=false